MKDWHLHYTGSLPRDFILANLKQKNPNFLRENNIPHLIDFERFIDDKFSNDYKKNKVAFDEIYALFQSVTKPTSDTEILSTYAAGAYEIAKTAVQNSLAEWIMISGPYTDINRTHDRYLGMIKGFERAEKELGDGFGKITITFIRDNTEKIKNFSLPLFDDIFAMLQQKPFANRIAGFDISGYEYPEPKLLQENIEILNQIIERKKHFKINLDIGLHAGETITGTPVDALYDDYFRKLARLDIQRIGHGTYLWLNHKTELLKLFAGKCVFDICPTSNRLLTPLGNNLDNMTDELKSLGVEFTLNRDDPSIFGNWSQP